MELRLAKEFYLTDVNKKVNFQRLIELQYLILGMVVMLWFVFFRIKKIIFLILEWKSMRFWFDQSNEQLFFE